MPAPKRGRSPAKALERRILQALRTLDDPSVPCNLVDLGCIYALDVNDAGNVRIEFTITERGHADGLVMPGRLRRLLEEIDGVKEVTAKLVWEPEWTTDRMTDQARQQLGVVG